MLQSSGFLRYVEEDKGVFVQVDKDIVRYYRSLLPTNIKLNIPRFDPHITVVRNEAITNLTNWRKYDGLIITFNYSTDITHDETYWWLPVECNLLFTIRESLGLNQIPPWHNGFHITIGNTKSNHYSQIDQ